MFVGRPGGTQEDARGNPAATDADLALRAARVVRFEKKGRSPFLAHAAPPKRAKPVRRRRKPAPKVVKPAKETTMPTVTITGIMWNPSNPVAMVRLSDGSSAVAKAGMTLSGDIMVKKVEKQGIRVVWEGKEVFVGK